MNLIDTGILIDNMETNNYSPAANFIDNPYRSLKRNRRQKET